MADEGSQGRRLAELPAERRRRETRRPPHQTKPHPRRLRTISDRDTPLTGWDTPGNVLPMNNATGPGGHAEPTNKAQRAAFARLSEGDRQVMRRRASELYDGTRTVSACWRQALAEGDL